MSKEALTKLIGRILQDEAFADQFKKKPGEVVKEYDLSPEEIQTLKSMGPDIDHQFSESLDRRMVKTDTDEKTDSSADADDADADGDDWWIGSVTG